MTQKAHEKLHLSRNLHERLDAIQADIAADAADRLDVLGDELGRLARPEGERNCLRQARERLAHEAGAAAREVHLPAPRAARRAAAASTLRTASCVTQQNVFHRDLGSLRSTRHDRRPPGAPDLLDVSLRDLAAEEADCEGRHQRPMLADARVNFPTAEDREGDGAGERERNSEPSQRAPSRSRRGRDREADRDQPLTRRREGRGHPASPGRRTTRRQGRTGARRA